ncbi:MAG: hypothetical protein IJK98_04965, partial [Clostridia bacterium]|nr:hypothetical protein [Clostridia bacterium]
TCLDEEGNVLDTMIVEYGQMPAAPDIPDKAPTATQHFTGSWNKTVVPATETATYTVVYTAENHTGGEATCSAQAVCEVCGTSYGELDDTNHKNRRDTDAVTANCITEGFTAGVYCDDCQQYVSGHESQGYNTAESGHSYGDWSSNGDGTHTKTCSRCAAETTNHTVTADCNGGTATCLVKAVCADCGEAYGEYAAHQLTGVPVQTPTCLSPGHVAYWYCSVCEKNFTDNTGATELDAFQNNHTQADAVKENDVPSTCMTKGSYDSVVYCSVCGTELSRTTENYPEFNPDNHTGNNTTTREDEVAPTCMAKGSYTEVVTCECGVELSRTPDMEIAVDPDNHTGNNTTAREDEIPATCMAKGSYTEVVTCECGVVLSRTPDMEIAVDPAKHTGNNTTTREDEVAPTCVAKGSYTEVVTCECGVELSRTEGKEIAIDPDRHTGDTETKEENVVDGTCVAERAWNEVVYCKSCGQPIATTPKTGAKNPENHVNTTEVGETASTCIAHGFTAGVWCNDCETWISGHTEKELSDHTWDEGEITKPATCIAMGETTYRCKVEGCGSEKTLTDVAIDTNNHTNVSEIGESDSVCFAHGYTAGTYCNDCQRWLSGHEEKPLPEHTWDEGEITKAATCTVRGETTYRCTVEGCTAQKTVQDVEIDPDNHANRTNVAATASTCVKHGYTAGVYCKDCGTWLSGHEEKALADHIWNAGTVTKAATCRDAGETVYRCTVKGCDKTRTEPIAINPKNHAGGTEVRDKVTETKDHDGYTGDTYCKGCGQLLKKGRVVTYQEGECPYCGGHHGGVLGAIVTALHGVIWLFHKAFGLGNPFAS